MDNSFINLISLMMYGFGDNQHPNVETVKLVENVVLKTLRDLLHETSKYIETRSLKKISANDIIFQLRHNRHKMQRILKYFDSKIMSSKLNNVDEEESFHKISKYDTQKKFIEEIDETGELSDIDEFDTIKYNRQLRAERISFAMDEVNYKEYSKARQASFFCKKFCQPDNFKQWVDPLNSLNLLPSAVELLELIAYNIIGNLVDMALIIKQNGKCTFNDPLKMLSGSCYNATMFNVPHLSTENKIQLGQPPISVREMREVIRRCNTPQIGYIKFTNRSILGKRKYSLM